MRPAISNKIFNVAYVALRRKSLPTPGIPDNPDTLQQAGDIPALVQSYSPGGANVTTI